MNDIKFTHQWCVVGKLDLGYIKRGDANIGAVENIIKLTPGGTAGVGRLSVAVSTFQAGGSQEQLQFAVTPQNIEITGHDDRLGGLLHHFVQRLQLVMAMAEFDGQVHQKNNTFVYFELKPRERNTKMFELNHQPFDPFAKIVESLRQDRLVGQDSIALLVQQRHFLSD